jgi:hypothetical protein
MIDKDNGYYCEGCSGIFLNGFDYIDHYAEEDGEEDFDPYLILPNSVKLQVGSLLRFLYDHADEPEQIRQIAESTYVTLYAAEKNLEEVEDMIKEMVINSEMLRFDSSLKTLLEEVDPDEEGRE